ncbi:PREDICTED: phenolphthiocerol synthesis polyketide synthase type I Pks15/1-like [Polistes canadensis]|uniref:phenolphthiocerol synthesis polyketide synthase type I Pks15/1-like n=1 Tax=Polistes canadensis TaxID=91411 RepID=UPI000718DB3A|nr:PREDICTED: phenolphthiocerol synthesis polyketide synthase type I Pks15/1-like [Polistes canadensis]
MQSEFMPKSLIFVLNTLKQFQETLVYFPQSQAQIMKQTLQHCVLKPSDVTYIDADGTAIKSMDLEELETIDLIYGQDQSVSNPLLIGSVKSNIGNAYHNNAINSIIKVLIAIEIGVIPPDLHYSEPSEEA